MTNLNLTGLFAESTETETNGTKTLAGTAQLTSISDQIAVQAIKEVDDNADVYETRFVESMTDNNVMDDLLKEVYDLCSVDITFLTDLDEETLDSMLKSQQSKRSRTKGKTMTVANYRTLMTAAAAELLIRMALGKPKSSAGYRRAAGNLEYTDEELAYYKDDQEALRREIRNVQSKKSIEKRKDDFSEESDRWIALLKAEEQLKSMRENNPQTKTVMIDTTAEMLKAELGDRDVNGLKAAEAKALIAKLLMANSTEADEETQADDEQQAE